VATITDQFGCTSTCTAQLIVHPNPTCVIAPATQEICAGASATFTVSVSSGTAPFTISWTGPAGFTGSGPTITINNAQEANEGTYTASVVDSEGCTTSCSAQLSVVPCAPDIEVTKEVACYLPGDTCGTYGKVATGVRDSDCPAFCYRITVTNAGNVVVTSLTVMDTLLGNISGLFGPLPLAPGDSRTAIIKPVELCQNTHNVVTATGTSEQGQSDVDTDEADAIVLNINIECDLTLSPTTLPAGAVDTPVTFTLVLRNTGTSPLNVTSISGLPALVDCATGTPVAPVLPFEIAPGESATFTACVLVSCPGGAQFSVSAHAEASDEGGTLCVFDENGNRVADDSPACTAVVECEAGAGCTPGFWKNCTIHWAATPYSVDQLVSSVFTLGNCCKDFGNSTLHRALSFGGGGGVCGAVRILLRAGVAALLNASSPEVSYPLTEPEIIASVNAALATCSRDPMIELAGELDRANNLGCRDDSGNELPCKQLTTP
jgi:hypothetical protein